MKINIMSGIPGCGKSYYVLNNIQPKDIYLSRDMFRADIRQSMSSQEYFPISEKEEWHRWTNFIADQINWVILKSPDSVLWIDQTTIGFKSLYKLITSLPKLDINITVFRFDTPLPLCLARNFARHDETQVPEATILQMHDRHKKYQINLHTVQALNPPFPIHVVTV